MRWIGAGPDFPKCPYRPTARFAEIRVGDADEGAKTTLADELVARDEGGDDEDDEDDEDEDLIFVGGTRRGREPKPPGKGEGKGNGKEKGNGNGKGNERRDERGDEFGRDEESAVFLWFRARVLRVRAVRFGARVA